jgi:hypothetical protein
MSEEQPMLRLKSSTELKSAAQQGILKVFVDCSGSISLILLVIGIIFIISTIASGVEANKADDKNDEQRKSIRGFAAASGIFGVVCLLGAIGMFVLKKMTAK